MGDPEAPAPELLDLLDDALSGFDAIDAAAPPAEGASPPPRGSEGGGKAGESAEGAEPRLTFHKLALTAEEEARAAEEGNEGEERGERAAGGEASGAGVASPQGGRRAAPSSGSPSRPLAFDPLGRSKRPSASSPSPSSSPAGARAPSGAAGLGSAEAAEAMAAGVPEDFIRQFEEFAAKGPEGLADVFAAMMGELEKAGEGQGEAGDADIAELSKLLGAMGPDEALAAAAGRGGAAPGARSPAATASGGAGSGGAASPGTMGLSAGFLGGSAAKGVGGAKGCARSAAKGVGGAKGCARSAAAGKKGSAPASTPGEEKGSSAAPGTPAGKKAAAGASLASSAAASSSPSSSPAASSAASLSATLEALAASAPAPPPGASALPGAGSGDPSADLLAALGAGGGSESDMLALVEQLMQQVLAKDVLYAPMKEIGDKYPEWLEKNRGRLSADEVAKYERQQLYIADILRQYDTDPNDITALMHLLQQMQSCGQPPQDIIDELAPGLSFGPDGMPSFAGEENDAAVPNCPIQ